MSQPVSPCCRTAVVKMFPISVAVVVGVMFSAAAGAGAATAEPLASVLDETKQVDGGTPVVEEREEKQAPRGRPVTHRGAVPRDAGDLEAR